MTTFVSNRDSGGKTNEDGHFRILSEILAGEVIRGLIPSSLPGNSMQVSISEGSAIIPHNGYSYGVWSDEAVTVDVPAANSSSPRLDAVVAYVDKGMSFNASQTNNPGALKFKVVSGTPSSSPTIPSTSAIQGSIGAGNPYIILARLSVPRGASAITSSNITLEDRRPAHISPNVSVPGVLTPRNQKIEFDVINEGDPLPPAVPGKTLIVFITRNG